MLLDELGQHLTDNQGAQGFSVHLKSLPITPDEVLVIRETPGQVPIHVRSRQGAVLERPRFQTLTRSQSYARAREEAERVYRLLDGRSGILSGVGYGRIHALQSPFYLQTDEVGRSSIITNFEAIKEPSPLAMSP